MYAGVSPQSEKRSVGDSGEDAPGFRISHLCMSGPSVEQRQVHRGLKEAWKLMAIPKISSSFLSISFQQV